MNVSFIEYDFKVDPSTSLAELSKILNAIPFAVVQNGKGEKSNRFRRPKKRSIFCARSCGRGHKH